MFLKIKNIKATLYTENLQITERVLYDNLLRNTIQELLIFRHRASSI